jgi:hypothetical protein
VIADADSSANGMVERAFKLFCDEDADQATLTDEELRDIVEEADRDNNGMISFEEFVYVMRKTSNTGNWLSRSLLVSRVNGT